jgi:hypothetical protein
VIPDFDTPIKMNDYIKFGYESREANFSSRKLNRFER